jgi:hypothetical protein
MHWVEGRTGGHPEELRMNNSFKVREDGRGRSMGVEKGF